jgi:hypothetical protein
MGQKATLTILKSSEEIRRLWEQPELRSGFLADSDARVEFVKAPGDRGTEIHVDLGEGDGKIASLVPKPGGDSRAKAMDELRRFKQLVETGVITRSEGVPEGELAERKLKQRPAQPLDESELEKANV